MNNIVIVCLEVMNYGTWCVRIFGIDFIPKSGFHTFMSFWCSILSGASQGQDEMLPHRCSRIVGFL